MDTATKESISYNRVVQLLLTYTHHFEKT